MKAQFSVEHLVTPERPDGFALPFESLAGATVRTEGEHVVLRWPDHHVQLPVDLFPSGVLELLAEDSKIHSEDPKTIWFLARSVGSTRELVQQGMLPVFESLYPLKNVVSKKCREIIERFEVGNAGVRGDLQLVVQLKKYKAELRPHIDVAALTALETVYDAHRKLKATLDAVPAGKRNLEMTEALLKRSVSDREKSRVQTQKQKAREQTFQSGQGEIQNRLLLSDTESNFHAQFRMAPAHALDLPDPKEFTHVSSEEAQRDQRHVEQQAKAFEGQRHVAPETIYGDYHENLILHLARQFNWFDARIIRASKYDDYVNGLDAVLELRNSRGERLHLGIDFTLSENHGKVTEKLKKLHRGGKAKYFRTQEEGEETKDTKIEHFPMVVLGIDRATIRQISTELASEGEAFERQDIQLLLLHQAKIQVGLQLRELAAQLVSYARQESASGMVGAAAKTYIRLFKERPKAGVHPADIANIFSHITREEITELTDDAPTSIRFAQLVQIYPRLAEQIRAATPDELDRAKGTAARSSTHKQLSLGQALASWWTQNLPAWGGFVFG